MARSDCRTVVSRNCVLIVDAHWKGQQARRINRPDGAVLAPHNAMVQELRVDVGSNDLAILVDATWESPDVKRAVPGRNSRLGMRLPDAEAFGLKAAGFDLCRPD